MKTFLAFLLLVGSLAAQQPQTRDNPIGQQLQGINAKWVNGVGPGYWPTWTSGLTISVSAGTCFDSSGARHAYAGGTISVTNATNYIDLKDSDCSIEISTSAYQTNRHLATVVASAGSVSSVTDDRSWFIPDLTTVNGQSCLLGSSCNVNAGAATHSIALNEGAGAAIAGLTLGAHQVPVGATSADPNAKTVPDCTDTGGNHLNFTQSTDAFSCGTSTTGGSTYTLQINASTLTAADTVNFNDTTPAAAANGLNIKWQKSTASTTDSVSGYVPGDGNAAHYLDGTGAFTTPSGGSATQGPWPLRCNGDTSGNVFPNVAPLSNSRWVVWEWNAGAAFGGTDVLLHCAGHAPHSIPSGTPKVVFTAFANDSAGSGHTMTFKECDNHVTTTFDIGSPSCSSTSNFAASSTANSPQVFAIALQTTLSADDDFIVIIHATAEANFSVNPHITNPQLEYQ